MAPFCLLQAGQRRFYNCSMRFALFFPVLLVCMGACRAQSPTSLQAPLDPTRVPQAGNAGVVEQRTERIHVEDAAASIDELRIGGETRSIKVQPKGGMPAYEISPGNGERSWKILSF
jgi:hypothetical protein